MAAKRKDPFSVLLSHANMSPEEVSELLWARDSFGTAWLILYFMKKKKIPSTLKRGCPPSRYLRPGKAFLFLMSLPKSVEELRLDNDFLREEFCPVLRRFLDRLNDEGQEAAEGPCLRSLWFQGCELTDKTVKQMFPSLPAGLQELNLAYNWNIGPAGWACIGSGIKNLKGLKKLELAACELTDPKVEGVFPSLPTGLEELNLELNPDIGVSGWAALGARLKKLEGFKKLDLMHCKLSDEKVEQLFPSLPSGLEELHLAYHSEISPAGWGCLGGRLKSLDRLRQLNLFCKPIVSVCHPHGFVHSGSLGAEKEKHWARIMDLGNTFAARSIFFRACVTRIDVYLVSSSILQEAMKEYNAPQSSLPLFDGFAEKTVNEV